MLYKEKAFQRCYEIVKKQPSNCAFRQRPKSFTDLYGVLQDGWIARDCQFLKCHEACRIGLRPPPTVHLLLHWLPVQWRNQEGIWVGLLGSSFLRHQTTKWCIGKAHHHGLYSNQTMPVWTMTSVTSSSAFLVQIWGICGSSPAVI